MADTIFISLYNRQFHMQTFDAYHLANHDDLRSDVLGHVECLKKAHKEQSQSDDVEYPRPHEGQVVGQPIAQYDGDDKQKVDDEIKVIPSTSEVAGNFEVKLW